MSKKPVRPEDTIEYAWARFSKLVLKDMDAKQMQDVRDIFFAGATASHYLIQKFFNDDSLTATQAIEALTAFGKDLDRNSRATRKRADAEKAAKKIIRDVAKAKVKR